jgi:hypothetical protein
MVTVCIKLLKMVEVNDGFLILRASYVRYTINHFYIIHNVIEMDLVCRLYMD